MAKRKLNRTTDEEVSAKPLVLRNPACVQDFKSNAEESALRVLNEQSKELLSSERPQIHIASKLLYTTRVKIKVILLSTIGVNEEYYQVYALTSPKEGMQNVSGTDALAQKLSESKDTVLKKHSTVIGCVAQSAFEQPNLSHIPHRAVEVHSEFRGQGVATFLSSILDEIVGSVEHEATKKFNQGICEEMEGYDGIFVYDSAEIIALYNVLGAYCSRKRVLLSHEARDGGIFSLVKKAMSVLKRRFS